ncbi:MAG: FAD-dependent oxidoreductase, partial [Bacteroidota bacterium]
MEVDVLVMGTGPAGSSVAEKCAKAGKEVAIVDRLFGGTCALRGCTPKKAMETVTSAYWKAKALEKAGFPLANKFVDWRKLIANKSRFTSLVPARTKAKFAEKGIQTLTGNATFVDEHTIKVGDEKIKAKYVVIATGAAPRPLAFSGAKHLINNEDFFDLDHLPQKVVITGGGYVGFEFSHILAACGVEVTILSNEEMPLGAFDSDLVVNLVQATLAKGIEVKLGYEVTQIKKLEQGFEIISKRKDDFKVKALADLVI